MHRFERINMHGVFHKPRHVLYSPWKELICLLGFILHYLQGICNVICHLTYLRPLPLTFALPKRSLFLKPVTPAWADFQSPLGRGPLAKIISLRGNPLGNRFSVIQCIAPWMLDYHKKFASKKLAKHRENGWSVIIPY
jgi:hypothetical protein